MEMNVAHYMMVMIGTGGTPDQWSAYIGSLVESGKFRGGSALGRGVCVSCDADQEACDVTGFMKFEASTLAEVLALVPGNPVYESGEKVEVLELVES